MPRIALRRPRGFIALAGLAALTAVFAGAHAQAPKPNELQQLTARFVAMLLERGHMSKPTIDDAVAGRWARNFIESLDPLKYNFLKGDVDEFLGEASTLDDQVKRGDVSWADKVFARFLKRSDERLEVILKDLEQQPDLTADETILDDPKRMEYPADAAEAADRVRKLIKLDVLRMKLAKTEGDEALNRLRIRYKDLNRYYKQQDANDLLERYLTTLAMAIDPHSAYWQAKTAEVFLGQDMHLSLEGIGASLQTEDGYPTVKEIVAGGAADKDGRLQVEDKIVGIESEDGQKDDFVGKKLDDVVRKIRGPAGTKVKLLVQPAESKDLKTYELTRQKIELTEKKAKGQIIESKLEGGKPVKIGVISLPSFYGDSRAVLNNDPDAVSATLDCKRLLEDFKKQGVDVALVDLRGNGGGLLNEAVTLSGLFIDEGPVVQIRKVDGIEHHDDDERGTAWDGPMAVVIDHHSASASEIFAGVIQDYGRGLVLGDSSSYGKGTVQSLIPLNEQIPLRAGRNIPDLGMLKLTIQQFYRANGASTQIKGVEPDVHLPSFLDYQEVGESQSDTALKFDRVNALPHDVYQRVPAKLVETLRERSEARRKDNTKFQEQAQAIQRYRDRKARHEISLNEARFRAETIAQENEDEEARPKEKKKRRSERPAWESNFYNDEIIAIITDYVGLGGNILTAGPIHADASGRPLTRP